MSEALFRRMLVPTDGSENSQRAGELAFRLPEQQGQNYLDHLERLAERYQVETRRHLVEGDPYREIVDFADKSGIDLIVMGHAGLRGPRRKIAGSVAERVIRFAHCPVLVLGASA
jgi:nucleotide-binding universal stress UspA family protein